MSRVKKANIEYLKRYSLMKIEANKNMKNSICFICGKTTSSMCNSHTVPAFVLKNLAENGEVYLAIIEKKHPHKKSRGIKNSGIFKLICNKCDSEIFQNVEEEKFLLETLNKDQLSKIALKTLLYEMYNKIFEIKFNEISSRVNTFNGLQPHEEYWKADVVHMRKEIDSYLESNMSINHTIILDEILDYKTDIACSTTFVPKFDIAGNIRNDTSNIENFNVHFGYLYISIFPLSNKTRVLVYYRRRYKNYYYLYQEFARLTTQSEKLKRLSDLLVLYSDKIYMTRIKNDELSTIKWFQNYSPGFSDDSDLYQKNLKSLTGFNLFYKSN